MLKLLPSVPETPLPTTPAELIAIHGLMPAPSPASQAVNLSSAPVSTPQLG